MNDGRQLNLNEDMLHDEFTDPVELNTVDRDEQSESFINALSKAVNDHPAVTTNGHIALLGQAAMQLAIAKGVKKKRFISAMNTYYLQVLKRMR